jgi:ferredoxin
MDRMSASSFFQTDVAAWSTARERLLADIHAVDRDAVRIWCQFYPLALANAFAASSDRDALTRQLRITGTHSLATQADTSHWFFYGHRYWPLVKATIVDWAADRSQDVGALDVLVRRIGDDVAARAGVEADLTLAISFVGLLTLRQLGPDPFRGPIAAATTIPPIPGSPEAIVAARQRDDSQGLFGFLRGQGARFTIRFDERRKDGCFRLIDDQHLTTAAAEDKRDYSTASGIRSSHEGPIPCDCRSASCGTCWVGILGGAEKLSEPEPLEARRLIEFGYWPTPDRHPVIRLACMARASGNVTLVIPTWHGRIGGLTRDTNSRLKIEN